MFVWDPKIFLLDVMMFRFRSMKLNGFEEVDPSTSRIQCVAMYRVTGTDAMYAIFSALQHIRATFLALTCTRMTLECSTEI